MHRAAKSLVVTLAILGLSIPRWAEATGDSLIEAVQRQEVDTVRKLLDQGVDVNAKTHYGATALFFACDKATVELAKLLLEKGAEVDVTDTFYSATPLTWAIYNMRDSPAHREIVLLLLDEGPADAGAALGFGARHGDLELVKAALETGKVEPASIVSSLKAAETAGQQEIVDYLAERVPEELPAEPVEVSPQRLASYVGDYKNDDIGMTAKVFLEGEELKLQPAGQPALTLDATGPEAFTARESPGIDLTFRGRGGMVEGFLREEGGQERLFRRYDPEAPAAEPVEALPALPEPERRPPVPWPRFRGPAGSGIGDGQGAPSAWDGESGKHVRWKTPIPGLALSSPVIWGHRVFVTTAVPSGGDASLRTGLYGDVDSVEDDSLHTWKVYALNSETGEILWERTAAEGAPKVKRHLKASQANPTPATDGRHLVVQFASEGLYCYDIDGKLMWKKDLGVLSSGWFYDPTYEWGFSSSPVLFGDRVIIEVDIQKGSFIAAYDVTTGKELWKTQRAEIPSWGTPAVLASADEGGVDEIVTNGTTIRGYDAKTGQELWRLGPNSEITVASPVVADGVAYVTAGYPPVKPIYAVRPGGRGDLSLPEGASANEHVLWSQSRGGTYIPTPIIYRGILYLLQNNGRLAAYEAATGELLYRERVGKAESFSASPVAADGRLYFTTEEGTTYVVRAGRSYRLLGTNQLGEVVIATPAISDGLLVIRGQKHVWGLGRKAP